jgi:hypothetical protein
MTDREKVVAGLTMLVDRKNDDTCEGLKCCKIAEDALALLKEQPEIIRCKDCIHADISASGLIKCQGYFRTAEWYCADGERK